jgi:hypothetical protein
MEFNGGCGIPTMDSLRELRVDLQLEVRVWGIDTLGKPFSQAARTIEISALGARLTGIQHVQQGDIIGLQYGQGKARFRVVWIGAAGGEQVGSVGVECVEPGKCIWMEILEEKAAAAAAPGGASAFDPAIPPGIPPSPDAAKPGEWPQHDRRRYPRFPCSGMLRLKQIGTDFATTQKLTDVSLGGCYGESMAPLERHAMVDMVLEVCGESIPARGMVRTYHSSMGNGIGFTQVAPEDWKKLVHAIRQLGGGNVVFDAPAEPELGDAIEALLSLLQKKGVHLTRDEFLDELRHRMTAGAK